MPLPTSDFRNPICLEMKMINSGLRDDLLDDSLEINFDNVPGAVLMGLDDGLANNNFHHHHHAANDNVNNNGCDIGSMDSSGTYASCQTQPFLSQGDLTADATDLMLDSNLYVNPLQIQAGDRANREVREYLTLLPEEPSFRRMLMMF